MGGKLVPSLPSSHEVPRTAPIELGSTFPQTKHWRTAAQKSERASIIVPSKFLDNVSTFVRDDGTDGMESNLEMDTPCSNRLFRLLPQLDTRSAPGFLDKGAIKWYRFNWSIIGDCKDA